MTGSSAQADARQVPAAGREELESARQRLEAMPPDVSQRLALAEACFRLAMLPDTEIEAAMDLLRQAAQYDPYHPKLFFHLGRLLHQNGEPLAAVFEYRRALRLAPRSHRTSVHLALALLDAGPEERELAARWLAALFEGADGALPGLIADLDKLIAGHTTPKSEPGRPAARRGAEDAQTGQGGCRWRGFWKLLLVSEIGRSKNQKKAMRLLDAGRDLVEGPDGAAEYALAGLLFLVDSAAQARLVEARLLEPQLALQQDRPAVRLVRSACELGAAETPADFVHGAVEKLRAGELPPELVCCLHLSWYGQSSGLDAVAAARLLDLYPADIASLGCFRELRVAILDHHARLAWSGDRLDRAEILWQEATAADPYRIPLAHNLALVATRNKEADKYQRAWDRAAELRYLISSAAGDPRVELDDRVRLHRSFAQQSRLRYVDPSRPGHTGDPSEAELLLWLEDREAIGLWLRESELAFFNSRLRFQSPLHLLGLPRDCADEGPPAAAEILLRQFQLCFRGRRWAGIRTFQAMLEALTAGAVERAKDPIQRKRDVFFETERGEAEKLLKETIEHGLLLFRMIQVARASASARAKLSGLQAAGYLLTMPWRFLEPACKKIGMLAADTDLMDVFLSHVVALALEESRTGAAAQADFRLQALDDCVRGAPDALELRLLQCRLLLDAKRYRQAYDTALEALPLTAKMADREEAARLNSQFIVAVDNAVLAQIPERLRSPGRENIAEFIAEVRRLLAEYPRAGGLRLTAASLLIRSAAEDASRLAVATEMLEQGLDLLLSDEQVREARQLLEKAGSQSETLETVSKIRKLLESAAASARSAVALTSEERTPAKTRQAREQLESAIYEAAQAEEIAEGAKLRSAAERARSLAADLRRLMEEIAKG